ncbi:MAG: hypothetical protein ACYC9M_16725 [Desulfobulbaceae bacterium]
MYLPLAPVPGGGEVQRLSRGTAIFLEQNLSESKIAIPTPVRLVRLLNPLRRMLGVLSGCAIIKILSGENDHAPDK